MSSFQVFDPSPMLAPYVTTLWVYEEMTADALHPWTMLPDTSSYICFLHGDPARFVHKNGIYTARSGLSGFQTYRFDIDCPGKISGVTVRLTAWGLSAFLGDAVGACADIRVDCLDLFSRSRIEEIEERLFHLKTAEEKARLVEAFLLEQLREREDDRLVRAACMKLNHTGGMYPLGTLANDFSMSERTMERRFLRLIGTTPKKYARVLRLRNAIAHRKHLSSWAEIAQLAGYYDQSHLIRDCREMYGSSPDAIFPMALGCDTPRHENTYRIAGSREGRIHREHMLLLLEESRESL